MTTAAKETAATTTIEVAKPQAAGVEIDPLAIMEQRNKMLERVLEYAISATHADQWVNQNGKPWPTAAAAEVMARRCAVRIRDVKSKKIQSSDDRGPFYFYLVEATVSLPGEWDSIEAMGTCSSRDQFLGTETKEGRPLSDIEEGDILKAAYSNLVVNGVTRLLGVRNLTWERLGQLGIDQAGATKIEYRQGGKGGGANADTSLLTIPFGRNKGKKLSEIEKSDLDWLAKRAEEDVAKNDPKWHAKNLAWQAAIKTELARRAPANSKTPREALFEEIVRLGAGRGLDLLAVKAILKDKLHRTKPAELEPGDLQAFDALTSDADIPF